MENELRIQILEKLAFICIFTLYPPLLTFLVIHKSFSDKFICIQFHANKWVLKPLCYMLAISALFYSCWASNLLLVEMDKNPKK